MAPEKNTPLTRPALPGATLAIALVSVLLFCWPALNGILIYDRAMILHGQIWRGWTGHLVHYSASHLLWNLAVFLSAGCWLEYIRPQSARWFYLFSPPVIAASLLVAEPTLEYYAGLSGVATGVLVFLGCVQLSENNAEPTWFWVAVFGLVVVKIALETVTHVPLLVSDSPTFRVVPVAHISGAGCGILAWVITRPSEIVTET